MKVKYTGGPKRLCMEGVFRRKKLVAFPISWGPSISDTFHFLSIYPRQIFLKVLTHTLDNQSDLPSSISPPSHEISCCVYHLSLYLYRVGGPNRNIGDSHMLEFFSSGEPMEWKNGRFRSLPKVSEGFLSA